MGVSVFRNRSGRSAHARLFPARGRGRRRGCQRRLPGQGHADHLFATWCAPCLQEIPTFRELHRKYEARGFSIVALSLDESGPAPVASLVQRAGINYPVLMADASTAKRFGNVVSVPTSFLVNKEGQVVKKYPGYVPLALLERDIAAVL